MTKAQYERERILRSRKKELRLLAESRESADPRYVMDAIALAWSQVLRRKQQLRDSLSGNDRRRVDTLIGLYA